MKLALIFIGGTLINSPIFCDEVHEHIKEETNLPEIEARYDCLSPQVGDFIDFLKRESYDILIICKPNFFTDLALLLAPQPHEILQKTDNRLFIHFASSNIFIYALDTLEKIPKFTLPSTARPLKLCLVGIEEESAQLLMMPLARQYGYTLTPFMPFLGANMLIATRGNPTPHSTPNSADNDEVYISNQEDFLKELTLLFGHKIFPLENLPLKIVRELKKREKIVATAESCTGGGVAWLLTQIPGASEIFYGGMVSYDNSIKQNWLLVSDETLQMYGAVSEACVQEMLNGILNACTQAHYAIAISGIAGPDGGHANKPVGTVFIGVSSRNGSMIVERILFSGNRRRIQQQASYYALFLLLRVLIEQ